VRRDQRRPGVARFLEGSVEAAGQTHETPQSKSERMSGLAWIRIVVGQLEARDDHEPVLGHGPFGLRLNCFEVGVVRRLDDRGRGSPDGLICAKNVVGDRKDVETGTPVEIDQLVNG